MDTQDKAPPTLRVDVNGQSFARKLTPGAGAVTLRQPDKGVPSAATFEFPARLLKAGANEIGITTTSGSWLDLRCDSP